MARMQPKLSNNKKRQLQTLVEQANLACVNGRFDICEQLCRRIDSMQPGHADVANLRGIMCMQTGQTDAAIHWLKQATGAAPRKGEYFVNLGKIYLDNRRWNEAADSYHQAMLLGKKSQPVQLSYCKALIESGQYRLALPVLKKLHKQLPRDADILLGLFMASESLNMIEEAEGYLQAVFAIDPDHAEAHAKMGRLELQRGRLAEAEAEARKVLSIQPDSAKAYDILLYVKKYQDANDPDIAGMTRRYEQSAPDSRDRQAMCFMLGKVMEQLKQYDRAFELLAEGNAIRHKKSTYNADAELAHMEQIMAAYTPEVFSRGSSLDDATPVFILGMPRCGSTLTEQILAAHPDVASRGECDIFERRVLSTFHSADDPLTLERLTAFTPEQWSEVGRMYLKQLRGNDTGALRITDKTLTSIRQVGAIHCALPNAKIVHVRRHPLDTCLSIFKLHLEGALFDYGYSLGELGYYYRMYLRLMQHWRDVLPAGVMYELDYERLIANQEEETRKLLDYCGLPWNDQCLQFEKTKNIVRSASVAQVRRPIYSDSLAAWKPYEKHLQPLIRILGPEYSTNYKVQG